MDRLNKKSVVFTFIAVTLLFIIILIFLININNRTSTKIQTTNIKVETLNNVVKNLNSTLLPDALRSSSNQAMISLLDYESNTTYVIDVEDYLRQVMNDGNYNSVLQEDMFQDNLDFTLVHTLDEVRNLAERQGAIFNYQPLDFNTLTIRQDDPWNVVVEMSISYSLSDAKNEISWDIQDRVISTRLDVGDYRDPLYLVQPESRKSIYIMKTPYANFNNINDFIDHVYNFYFITNVDAPSFLERLHGQLVPSGTNGIESILSPVLFSNPSDYSNVDHQYFSLIPGQCVQGMPSNFFLESSHLTFYNRISC